MKHLIFFYLIILLTYSSCKEKVIYNEEVCNDLSMKFFRGLPKPSKEYKDNCTQYKLKYNQEVCKKALQDLMLGGRETGLKKKYGDKIMGCFNNGDLDRFLKK